jgi:N-hydroxyarylamine O-acetyltransferase
VLDLDAYFERIGWNGAIAPTRATLSGLLRAHLRAIPFENLDVLLERPIRLDLASLQDKLVRAKRGGYCHEHATLFAAVLEDLGFAPLRHAARVVLVSPRTQSPRTHMFLSVPLSEGRFVVDPGFGGPAPQFPVPLVDQEAAEASHWMARDGNQWILRTRSGEKVFDAWVTSLEADHPIDFDMANHFTSTYPSSPFRQRLMMSIFTEAGRVTLLDRDLTIRKGTNTQTIRLVDRQALRAALVEHFGFDLPEVDALRVPAIAEWT